MHTVELHSMPWVIVENFNEPLSSADKLGGREVSISRSLLLKECLDKCNMVDLGYSSSRFTWTISLMFSSKKELTGFSSTLTGVRYILKPK